MEKQFTHTASWQCLCIFLLRHISVICESLAFTIESLPTASHYSAKGDTSFCVISDDATPSSSAASFFDSSALAWLDRRESTSVAPPSMPPSIRTSSFLASAESRAAGAAPEAPSPPTPTSSWTDQIRRAESYGTSKVKRVVDASTVQLDSGGYLSLDTVRGAGGTYPLPECMDRAPSYKLTQLLPAGTAVRYVTLDGAAAAASPSRAWLMRERDGALVNLEVVRAGFAFVRKGVAATPPGMMEDLTSLERAAKEKGLGIYTSCDAGDTDAEDRAPAGFVAEFQPMDATETRYVGGKRVLAPRRPASAAPPPNPADVPRPVRSVRGCSDFSTYEEALGWYETYAPFYGDVARLDRDGDGVPCPGLLHTTVAEQYRMKIPKNANTLK